MPEKKEMKPEETRTLLIQKRDGTEIQIDIPVTWKVTFGPAVVGSSERNGQKMPMALRVYESEKMQRLIFTDVEGFRDMSIPIRVKKVRVQEKDGYIECEGARKRTTFQASTVEWVNPDKAEESNFNPNQLQMPSDEEVYGSPKGHHIEVEDPETGMRGSKFIKDEGGRK